MDKPEVTFKQKVLLSIIGILIALILGEILLRIFIPNGEIPPKIVKYDPVLKHILTDNPEFGDGAENLLNEESLENADIVVLGDSHTAGIYRDGRYINWPIFLEKKTGKSILNYAIAGYGPVQYYALLDKAINQHPETIIIGFYSGNDLWDAYDMVYHIDYWSDYRSESFIDDEPLTAAELTKVSTPAKGFREFLRKYSKLYTFVGQRTRVLREYIGLSHKRTIGTRDWTTEQTDTTLLFDKIPEIKTRFWSGMRFKGMDLENKNIKEGMRLSLEFLRKIDDETKKNNIETFLVIIPSKEAAYENVVGGLADENRYFSSVVKNDIKIRNAILNECKLWFMTCIDSTPYLQSLLEQKIRIYPVDSNDHPVARGYEAYAEAVYDLIR